MILRPFSNKRLLFEPYTWFLNVIALDTKYQTKYHLQNSGSPLINWTETNFIIGCMKQYYLYTIIGFINILNLLYI